MKVYVTQVHEARRLRCSCDVVERRSDVRRRSEHAIGRRDARGDHPDVAREDDEEPRSTLARLADIEGRRTDGAHSMSRVVDIFAGFSGASSGAVLAGCDVVQIPADVTRRDAVKGIGNAVAVLVARDVIAATLEAA